MPVQSSPPANHPSARARINVLRKNIRKEQDLGRCIVLDLDILQFWPELFLSPFGIVDKGDADPTQTGRVIHDLSYPEGASVNDFTHKTSVPDTAYEPCDAIAREIIDQKRRFPNAPIKVLLGDVAAAFRNLGIHSQSAHLFAGTIPEDNALVIDLAACFGWTGSPGFYGIAGKAIAHIHGQTPNPVYPRGVFNYHWVDDHVCIPADIGSSCNEKEQSLRRAMITILGPEAVNDDKYTPWSTQQKVLGLVFDTLNSTVAIPIGKIVKATRLVRSAHNAQSLSRTQFRSLLGCLWHVATCIRPARAFLQRLRRPEAYLHRCALVRVTDQMMLDLMWWMHILQLPTLNGIPLDYFRANLPADITIEMDASDTGLGCLERSRQRILTYEFNAKEKTLISEFHVTNSNGFDINYRELLSCALAAHTWAQA